MDSNLGRKWVDRGFRLALVRGYDGRLFPGINVRWDALRREWVVTRWGSVAYRGQLHPKVVRMLRTGSKGGAE